MKIKEEDLPNIHKIGIYCITNLVNGKKYIGQTGAKNGFIYRWRNHKNDLNKEQHRNVYLQRSWNKYGEDNFEFSILEIIEKPIDITNKDFTDNYLTPREQYWIDYYDVCNRDKGYNICPSAGSTLGADFYTNRKIYNKIVVLLDLNGVYIDTFNSIKDAENYIKDKTGLKQCQVSRCLLHKQYKSGNYIPLNLEDWNNIKGNEDKINELVMGCNGEFRSKKQSIAINNFYKNNPKSNETRKRISKDRKGKFGKYSNSPKKIVRIDILDKKIYFYDCLKDAIKDGFIDSIISACIHNNYKVKTSGKENNIYKGCMFMLLDDFDINKFNNYNLINK